tara:strand:- start:4929 stop:5150 length:222 start_codon:yes stop_codon:yes gene_type:complete
LFARIVWYGKILLYLLPGKVIPKIFYFLVGSDPYVIAVKAVCYLLLIVAVQDMVRFHHAYLNTSAYENCNYWT